MLPSRSSTIRNMSLKLIERKPSTNSFKSYITLDDEKDQSFYSSADESFGEPLTPKILSGEMIIAEAQNALLFTPVTEQKTGKSGVLTVTNFRLSFVTSEEKSKNDYYYQENLLLGEYDVCLSNVDSLYVFSGDKKRKLLPGYRVPQKVKLLQILCKNMKVLTFSFKFSPVGHGKTLTNALLHHAFPRRHQLLFAYDYNEPYYKCDVKIPTFRDPQEWKEELIRTGSKGWRLCSLNQHFHLSPSLPQYMVVGKDVRDFQITTASQHFRCNRPPVWCWSSRNGAALVRMADICPTIHDRVQENIMLETVRKSHPKLTAPNVMELGKDLPSTEELKISYNKLRELCTPNSVRQFWAQDIHFYSLLDGSKWLSFVSACLGKAVSATQHLRDEITVVLQEADGRDMCCVLSSLTMLLCDPHFRTIRGFQSMVQKEWIVMGHPFCARLGHVYANDNQQSPVFLLFLDCVWQMLQQFPAQFEFTETYLTTLWDTAHISIFDTFLFDCDRDRIFASSDPNTPLILRSVWDWGELFSDKDIALFLNPLFVGAKSLSSSSWMKENLKIKSGVSDLHVWSQCYFRFLPLLELTGGGKPQVDLAARRFLREEEAESTNNNNNNNNSGKTPPNLRHISSFFPFARWKPQVKVPPSPALSNSTLVLNASASSDADDNQSVVTITEL